MFQTHATFIATTAILVGSSLVGCGGSARSSELARFPGELRATELRSGGARQRETVEGSSSLERAALVRAVLAKNPGVASARHAWRAARAREAQESAWPDPMLSYSFAPLSIGSADVHYGQVVQLSQRLPWPGKLSSRGESAEAEAQAARGDYAVTRLDLALEAALAYADLWFVDRSLEINDAHQRLLRELKQSAEAQYSVGRASLQDPLQAEVEVSQLEQQGIVLEAERSIITARINTLLHRAPQAKLPPPPRRLDVSRAQPAASAALQRTALAQRAELERSFAQIRAAEFQGKAAEREYYPDVTLMASYNSMWREVEHQFMLGLEAPIPLQRGGRGGAVDEASARAAQARSDLARTVDAIRADVEIGRARVLEALHVVRLYEQRLEPLARDQLAAARAGFVSGANAFVALVEAQKNLRSIELARQAALAELDRRWSMLDRATGRVPGLAKKAGER